MKNVKNRFVKSGERTEEEDEDGKEKKGKEHGGRSVMRNQ
jgi:hypothetical protein